MQETAASRYSHALFETASESEKIDTFLDEFQTVSRVFNEHNELYEFFNHPNVKIDEKKNVIQEIFKGIETELVNLILLLIEHGRINEIQIVYEDFKAAVYMHKGIKVAYATTAVQMTAEEIDMLREKLDQKYGPYFEINNIIDPEVLGGVYLRIGDEVIDGSIRGGLERMRKELFTNIAR